VNFLVPFIAAVCGIGGLVVAVVTYLSSRRRDAGTLTVATRVAESDRLSGLNEALGRDLDRTQKKVEELEATVDRGNRKARELEEQVNVALANVGILLSFIDQHVPVEVMRPRLREVRVNGR
jgi:hypothetical protein